MTAVMDRMLDGFSRRIAGQRRMMAHLGIEVPPERAQEFLPELRATLSACLHCPDPDLCGGWIRHGDGGVPCFCRAREALSRLADRTGARA
jgi:hypothetical protein